MTEQSLPEIITRKQAREFGLKFFFVGRKCKRGHTSNQYTSDTGCVQCKTEYHAKHSEKYAKMAKDWRREHPDYKAPTSLDPEYEKLMRKKTKERYHTDEAFRLRIVKDSAEYRKKNPEKAKAANIASKEKAKAKGWIAPCVLDGRAKKRRKEYDRKIMADPVLRERKNARQREWRKENPEKTRVSDTNKRVQRRKAEGRFTWGDVQKIAKAQRNKCCYCPNKFKLGRRDSYHVDHIISLARGGTNWPKNIQLLCPTCNMRKKTKHPIDFAQENGFLL